MDVVFLRCAGLDVHKKSITACRIVPDPTGQEAEGIAELRTFGTMTLELLALADWLTEASITHVAMESTGGDRLMEPNWGFTLCTASSMPSNNAKRLLLCCFAVTEHL